MTEQKQLRDNTTEITIRPAVGSRLRVAVDSGMPFDESRVAWGVSVYGDGRIFYHDETDRHDSAITNAWTRELVKAARDLHERTDCLLDDQGQCVGHEWYRTSRCPQARLTEILAALDQTEWKPTADAVRETNRQEQQ